MRSPRLSVLALAAAMAIVPACGDDDDGGATTNRAATATTEITPTGTTPSTTPAPTATTSKDAKSDPTAGRVVQAFFNAMSERDGDTACNYLDQAMKGTAVLLVRRQPGNSAIRTCGAALTRSVRQHTAAQLRPLRDVRILSSTADGELATVKVRRSVRDVLLKRQQGRWVITSGVFNPPQG